jgi:hypothetical protein
MKKISFASLAPNALRSSRRRIRNAYENPRRHWWMGLAMFSVIVLTGSAVLARAYFLHESFDTLVGTTATSTPQYQERLIKDVMKIYTERTARYDALISSGTSAKVVETASSTPDISTTTDDVATSTITSTTETGIVEGE